MGWMGRVLLVGVFVCGVTIGTGCEAEQTDDRISIESHLFGPGARLGHGITVPEGANRVGPTIPTEQERGGDVVGRISMLQFHGDPDQVMHDLLVDLGRRVPDADVEPDKARRRCRLDESREWIEQCRLLIAGHTPSGVPIQVDVTATPTADTDGIATPGTTGLPQARVLIRRGMIREVGTNLYHPRGFAFSIREQEAARWPIASDADNTVDASIEALPGVENWPVRPGGVPIGIVYSNPRYAVVAVDEGENVQEVATSYITSVPNERLRTTVLARVGQRTTTSYEIDEVEGGAGAHLWAVDRPGTDYLYLRYWPVDPERRSIG